MMIIWESYASAAITDLYAALKTKHGNEVSAHLNDALQNLLHAIDELTVESEEVAK